MAPGRLDAFLDSAAQQRPHHTAIIDPGTGDMTYDSLAAASASILEALKAAGIRRGDRIGICAPKSIGTVAALFACLKADACYVPVDAAAPVARSAFIFEDCDVAAVLIHAPLLESLAAEFHNLSSSAARPIALPAGAGIDLALVVLPRKSVRQAISTPQELLAYILYTSGSTGKPKGVMHSHRTALSFVDWCSEELAPTAEDVFSSHAPFHFDLSIFDLYVSIKHQATLVLINEENGKQPLALAAIIDEQDISVWYSTPSILRLLLDYGKLEQHDLTALRLILYAGEVFPLKHLRSLTEALPLAQYYNLYGPTETNVCTYYKLSLPLPDDELLPQRIGFACSGDRTMVANDAGQRVASGEEGELWVAGGSVHLGYWNLPDQNASVFHVDADGTRWYKTGDLVVEHGSQGYVFRGRRDRMVKRRGYRVELGEIESVLYAHPCISEVAVVALPDESSGLRVVAFLQWTGDIPASTVELKRFASENLLSYMIPDRFVQLDTLPKTSTDKIDYQRLKEAAA